MSEKALPSARTKPTETAIVELAGAGPFDIVVGVNARNEETTIVHVLSTVCEGLRQHYPNMRSLVVVVDGFSTDRTRDLAEFYPAPRGIRKIVLEQSGGRGKGNGIRTLLGVAQRVGADACAFVDGDLVSIRPIWVDKLVRPLLHGLTDVVIPHYLRDKWDGIITNHLCYPFTAALYGSSVRQPIGGEYGLSRRFLDHVLDQPDFPTGFGVDIYLTTTAIAKGFRIQEAPLGIKIHASTVEYVDPRKGLSRMYREVVGTMFDLAIKFEPAWRACMRDETFLVAERVIPYYDLYPQPTLLSEENIRAIFAEGLNQNAPTLEHVLPSDVAASLAGYEREGFPADVWARIVYSVAAWYVANPEGPPGRAELLEALSRLGMGRFLGFVQETRDVGLADAYQLIQEQARVFQGLRSVFEERVDSLRAVFERVSSTPGPG